MQRVWLIRAGDDAEKIDPMRAAGLIGISAVEIGDASMMSGEDLEQAFIDARRPGAVQWRSRMQSFVGQVKPGDLVVTPNAARREVWLSIVTGDYRFDPEPEIDQFSHTRTVDWLGWLDRDAHWMSDQLKVIDQPVAIVELYNREWWWKHFDAKELSSAPRPSWSKPAPTRAATTRAGSTRAPSTRTRSAAAAKPKPSTRPKPVAMVLCAGQCGLQWAPQVLVGGLCPDCRGD